MQVSIVAQDPTFIKLVNQFTTLYSVQYIYGPFYKITVEPNEQLPIELILTYEVSEEQIEFPLIEDNDLIKIIHDVLLLLYVREYGSLIQNIVVTHTSNTTFFSPKVTILATNNTVDTTNQDTEFFSNWNTKFNNHYLYQDAYYPLYYHTLKPYFYNNYNWEDLKKYTTLLDVTKQPLLLCASMVQWLAVEKLKLNVINIEHLALIPKDDSMLFETQNQALAIIKEEFIKGIYPIENTTLIKTLASVYNLDLVSIKDDLFLKTTSTKRQDWVYASIQNILNDELPLETIQFDLELDEVSLLYGTIFNLIKEYPYLIKYVQKIVVTPFNQLNIPFPTLIPTKFKKEVEEFAKNKLITYKVVNTFWDGVANRIYLTNKYPNERYMVLRIRSRWFIVGSNTFDLPEFKGMESMNNASEILGITKSENVLDFISSLKYISENELAWMGIVNLPRLPGFMDEVPTPTIELDVSLKYNGANIWSVYIQEKLVDKIETLEKEEKVKEMVKQKANEGKYTLNWYNFGKLVLIPELIKPFHHH